MDEGLAGFKFWPESWPKSTGRALALQRQMQLLQPCEKVVTLNADHSTFFLMPGELAEVLDGLARQPTPGLSQ
ncbi:hypothetical protein [Paraburkholderia sp. BL23I1N1]|uniref:hypothetical protein n=1 Tax=Paraburkholderia sp. BL23I1N1 TaxID=1938802 RepID=UPI000E70B799|nr:hypothetical protein [Paraburkholderia sp. BL23I1N1]